MLAHVGRTQWRNRTEWVSGLNRNRWRPWSGVRTDHASLISPGNNVLASGMGDMLTWLMKSVMLLSGLSGAKESSYPHSATQFLSCEPRCAGLTDCR